MTEPLAQVHIVELPDASRLARIIGEIDTSNAALIAAQLTDAVDASSTLAGPRLVQALSVLAQRYARSLNVNLRDVQEALDTGRQVLRRGGRVADASGADERADGHADNGVDSADADDLPGAQAHGAPTAERDIASAVSAAG